MISPSINMRWTVFWVKMFKPIRNIELLRRMTVVTVWCDFNVAHHFFIPGNDNGQIR